LKPINNAHRRVDAALQKCPQLVCVHVETRDEKGKADGAVAAAQQQQPQQQSQHQQPPQQHDRTSQKACLDRYREASEEVIAVMARFAARIEKASIDEAYLELDVGRPAPGRDDDEEEDGDGREQGERGHVHFTEEELLGIDAHRIDPSSPIDRPLLLGARVVARLRQAVFEVRSDCMHAKTPFVDCC
jgi:nucleotidyltransferase/DNA polymerase involved in DNA repair